MTSPFQTLTTQIPEIEAKLGHEFKNKDLITQAFLHRSFTNESPLCPLHHNERLEFLGDAVLGLIAADYFFKELPGTPEGELTHLRARLVEGSACTTFLNRLDLLHYILLGKGERRADGRGRNSIAADLFEALIGAIFLDEGFKATEKWFHAKFSKELREVLERPMRNFKADLQDYSQKATQSPPTYEVRIEEGPDHNRIYEVAVLVADEEVGYGKGRSKKEAQQAAAEDAIKRLEQSNDGQDKE